MEKQHLTYFKIENFKRFDSFEMNNLGQFNLIVGDNNVGKTSVLEGLLFDENLAEWRSNLISTISYRGFFGYENSIKFTVLKDADIWSLIFKDIEKPIIITANNEVDLQISLSLVSYTNLSDSEKVTVKERAVNPLPQLWLKQNFDDNEISHESHLVTAYLEDMTQWEYSLYMPFIPVNLSYAEDLVNFFYEHFNINKALKKELESNLAKLIPNLEEIRVHKYSNTHEVLCVTLTNSNSLYPLVRYGDGTVKITRILIEALLAQNKRLMIDEIGTGIHFSRLKDFWKTIIQLCSKYNIQLFSTTHSLECQRAFIEALEDEDMKQFQADARNITMLENKQGEIKAFTYNFDEFEYSLSIGINTRGGQL